MYDGYIPFNFATQLQYIKKTEKHFIMTTIKSNKNTGEIRFTFKEERFCCEYALHPNATEAAVSAGYSKKTAAQMASYLLSKDRIRERIQYLKNNPAEISKLSVLRVLKEHEKIAFADAGQIRDGWMSLKKFENLTPEQRAVIQEVTARETKYGTEIKIKLYDKQRSLDSINAMLGFNASKKTEITGKDGKDPFAELTDDELDAKIAELKNKLK
jgi:phage terminase small subunit